MSMLSGPSARPRKIATDSYDIPLHEFAARWSPDSRWIAYTKLMPNYLHAIFIYSLADGSTHQVTDAASDCLTPVFDTGGKYLYFTSSTDTGLAYGWLSMTSLERPITRSVYVATLQAATASPIAPRADFEKPQPDAAGAKDDKDRQGQREAQRSEEAEPPKPVAIDFQGLQARAVPLPLPAASYVELDAGKAGILYLVQGTAAARAVRGGGPNGPPLDVLQFSLDSRKATDVIDGITAGSVRGRPRQAAVPQGRRLVHRGRRAPRQARSPQPG